MDKSGPRLRVSRKQQAALLTLLRQVREEKGLRQADVANALGCPQSVVSKYESGERRVDLIELRGICIALGLPLSTFVRRFERLLSATPRNES
jgi:transcriptional regulator with XRE-family HTH domain